MNISHVERNTREYVHQVSDHYTRERGKLYKEHYQTDTQLAGYEIDFSYFRPYLNQKDTVLDFGCGNGGMLRHIRKVVARADGLEVNPEAAALAEIEGSIIYKSLAELPQKPTYDVIVSNHVLEHVRYVIGTLEELRGCLQPGGLFITKLPLEDYRQKKQKVWWGSDIDHHLHMWTPRHLANTFSEAGYEMTECRIITSAWHPKLFPLIKLGIAPLAFWALAAVLKRRQLFAVARVSADPDL